MFSSALTEQEVASAYERYGALVRRRCRRILRDDDHAADDATQEVFVRLWRYGKQYRNVEAKLPWLYRIAERACFDRMRNNIRAGELVIQHPPENGDGHDSAERVADRDVVMNFLERFDDKVKTVAVMHYLDGSTQEEIAQSTGWSRQTVAKKLTLLRTRASALKDSLYGHAL